MPIQVTCPSCKTALQVPDALAGKQGKCRCGTILSIPASTASSGSRPQPMKAGQPAPRPSAKPAPVSKANPIVASLLEQVTESDMKLKAVVPKVEAPPTKQSELALLKSFTKADDFQAPVVDANKRPTSAMVIGIFSLLIAFSSIAAGAVLFSNSEVANQAYGNIPEGAVQLLAVLSIVQGSLMLVAGIGLFTRIAILWYVAASVWALRLVDQLGWAFVGLIYARQVNISYTYVRFAGIVVVGGIFLYSLHSERVRKWFHVRLHPQLAFAITGGIGLVLGIIIPLYFMLTKPE